MWYVVNSRRSITTDEIVFKILARMLVNRMKRISPRGILIILANIANLLFIGPALVTVIAAIASHSGGRYIETIV